MSPIKSGKLENETYVVDLRGWMCPYPKYMLEPLLGKLPANAERLLMIVDCPSAVNDVPKEARAMGYDKSDITQVNNGEWHIVLQITPTSTGNIGDTKD